ncbi:MAG: sulfide/dihydroorotate dehydrogenase-like FAD/NAD-binding protein [Caldisericaceae bacterium]|nr:sulfide/dihydroorotate dehydrogenase-like FAD/NAD-binding protein [Caldisericaceae bacterium]
MFKILKHQKLGPKMQFMELDAPLVSRKAEPGQFIVLRVNETGERIPLTIADFNRKKGTVTIVFQEMGKTTHLLATKNAGDSISDVLGPLGNPSEIEHFGNVICIGGGIGVAPVYPLARKLKQKGNKVTSIIGYRSKNYVFWEDKMKNASNKVLITTNDGTYGEKGFVTDVLKKLMDGRELIDRIFAIGPAIMMKAVSDLTREKEIKTIVSLNSLMVCGMGMCGACRVIVGGETKFTCADGPDFDAHLVDFNILMKRLDTYKEEEKISFEKWKAEVDYYEES